MDARLPTGTPVRDASSPKAPKISVIVPIYKVEKYLAECIESVLAQTFTDFELILVDDGSPDNSGKICDTYAARDSRIRVFHKENGGVTSARRLGVEQSQGEWIMFVDSDDKVFPHALSVLLENAAPDIDLVEGKVSRDPARNDETGGKILSSDADSYVNELATYSQCWLTGPWAKIIRRKIISATNALDIPANITFGEDFLMLAKIAKNLRKATKIRDVIYFYRENPAGACAAGIRSVKYWKDFLKNAEKILKERWFEAWIKLSRRYFVTMFLTSPDFDARDNCTESLRDELWRKRKKFSAGTRIVLFVVKFFPAVTHRFVARILFLTLRTKLRVHA